MMLRVRSSRPKHGWYHFWGTKKRIGESRNAVVGRTVGKFPFRRTSWFFRPRSGFFGNCFFWHVRIPTKQNGIKYGLQKCLDKNCHMLVFKLMFGHVWHLFWATDVLSESWKHVSQKNCPYKKRRTKECPLIMPVAALGPRMDPGVRQGTAPCRNNFSKRKGRGCIPVALNLMVHLHCGFDWNSGSS